MGIGEHRGLPCDRVEHAWMLMAEAGDRGATGGIEDAAAIFRDQVDWVERTVEIAAECCFSLADLSYRFPSDELRLPGERSIQALRRLVGEGCVRRYGDAGAPRAVREQLEKELALIDQLAKADYFLSAHQVVQMARERKILCQGRGSAANSAVCYVLGVTSVAFITTPAFVVAIFLLLIFSIQLHWLPVTGAGDPGDPLDRLSHIILPATALSIGWIGYLARLIRASLLEVLSEQHVRMMRAYGVPEVRIVRHFALRLALVPMIAVSITRAANPSMMPAMPANGAPGSDFVAINSSTNAIRGGSTVTSVRLFHDTSSSCCH